MFILRRPNVVLAACLALFVACVNEPAVAQHADMPSICTGHAQASVADKIGACSLLIDQHKGDSERLAVLYTSRGSAWRQKGDFDRALADHDEAIRLQPGSALLYFNRAITWESKDKTDRAIADFDQAIRRAPGFALAYRNRGDLHYGKADYIGAIRDYDAAIRLAAKDPRLLTMRGLAKWQLGDGNGGKADIAAAMRIDVVTAIALVGRARPAGTASAASPSSGAPTIWDFKGSKVALKVEGTYRRFYYEMPRPELIVSNVMAGHCYSTAGRKAINMLGRRSCSRGNAVPAATM